jgi:hypothetical protein
MWLREVVKFLRFARDVLAEYVATEQTKYDAARQAAEAAKRSAEEAARREAEEAAQRRATDAAARDAERRSTRERQAQQTTLRRKQRRRGRQGAPVTIPVHTSPELAARMAATPSDAEVPTAPTPALAEPPAAPADMMAALMAGLPPVIVETLTQLQALDGAVRSLLTATDGMRAWFERIQAHPRWSLLVAGVSMMLPMIVPRISSGIYFRKLQEAHDRRWSENRARVDRMFDGDWREKVRYILWTNGQRRDRAIRAAVSAGLSPRDALPA